MRSIRNLVSLRNFFRALWNEKIRREGKKKRQRTYAPDAHNLSESCHVSSRSDPSLSHHGYQNATWAWHVPAIAGKCTVSLSLAFRQTDSQPGRHTDQCQNTRPAPPVVHLMKSITRTQSLPSLQLESLPACEKIDSHRSCISLFFPQCAWSIR